MLKNDNMRFAAAIVLCMAVLVAWNLLFPQPQAPVQDATGNSTQTQAPAAATAPPAVLQPETQVAVSPFTATPGRKIKIETPLYIAELNSQGGVLESLQLKKFKASIKPDSPLQELVHSKAVSKAPLGLIWNQRQTWNEAQWSYDGGDLNVASQNASLTLTGRMGEVELVRELTFAPDSYVISENVRVLNTGETPAKGVIDFTIAGEPLSPQGDEYNLTKIATFNAKGLNETSDEKDLTTGIQLSDDIKWAAVTSNYFMLALIPSAGMSLKAKLEDGLYRVAVEKGGLDLAPQTAQVVSCAYYLGPKDTDELVKAPNSLDKAIDYGWFDFVARPLMVGLKFFHKYVGNWGTAIILLTIAIKLIFWPLSQKSYKSMEQMRKIQPMMTAIREKHKDDRVKMNEEMMRLYKTYKVNPAGGCLPLLLQIPVFIGLYNALLAAIELRHAPFITHIPFTDIIWLADLSVKDPYYITPLVMGATMFLQQKMTPAPGDPTQAKVMMFMPVIFTFMFLNFPSGLVLYWLVNNVLSIAQQGWMLRKKS